MQKVLTISIAAYNAEKFINKAIDSLLECRVRDMLEIIIVNDGSKDNTLQIALQYKDKYPDIIKVIDKENGGHGSTINASIKAATGMYYKILDSDDWVDKEGLEKLVDYLECHCVDMILNSYNEVYVNEDRTVLKRPFDEKQKLDEITDIKDISNVIIYMHSLTFCTSVMKAMGPVIDEHCFYVDMEYTCLALPYVKSFVCLDYPVYDYMLGSQEQSMNTKNLVKRRDQHLKVIKRLIKEYSEFKGLDIIKEILKKRIRYAVLNQYKIYFNVDDRSQAKKEICEFDKWLLENCKDAYEGPEGRFMKIIRNLRKHDFSFFGISCAALKKLGLVSEI